MDDPKTLIYGPYDAIHLVFIPLPVLLIVHRAGFRVGVA